MYFFLPIKTKQNKKLVILKEHVGQGKSMHLSKHYSSNCSVSDFVWQTSHKNPWESRGSSLWGACRGQNGLLQWLHFGRQSQQSKHTVSLHIVSPWSSSSWSEIHLPQTSHLGMHWKQPMHSVSLGQWNTNLTSMHFGHISTSIVRTSLSRLQREELRYLW